MLKHKENKKMKTQLNNIFKCKKQTEKNKHIGFLLKCNFDIYYEAILRLNCWVFVLSRIITTMIFIIFPNY